MKLDYCTVLVFFTAMLFACNNDNQTTDNTSATENTAKADKKITPNNDIALQAPDFSDPELKKYYSIYTDYLKRVVATIRNKDEAGTMKIFREEGKQFDNKNDMDKKAQENEEQKFNTWLMQTLPYQKEIVQSEYYKKFTEEYYKNVKEKFKEKNQ